MAGTDQLLVLIDTIVINGQSIAFESGSGQIEGLARFSNEVVPSATGDDFVTRKRVATKLKAKIQFGPLVDPQALSGISGAQISMRDSKSGRRMLSNNACFGMLGSAGGGGSVDCEFLLLDGVQML